MPPASQGPAGRFLHLQLVLLSWRTQSSWEVVGAWLERCHTQKPAAVSLLSKQTGLVFCMEKGGMDHECGCKAAEGGGVPVFAHHLSNAVSVLTQFSCNVTSR